MTPVAAATVAPIQATNTAPSPTTTGDKSTLHTCDSEASMHICLQMYYSTKYLISYFNTSFKGSTPHTQLSSGNIVTMTVASHSSHATAVTTSTIPVGKIPFAHLL